jgi:hypothetical protein
MQRRTAVVVSFVAFCAVTTGGWVLTYFVTFSCIEGHYLDGRWFSDCSSRMGPVGFVIPILVGGVVAVLIQRRAG